MGQDIYNGAREGYAQIGSYPGVGRATAEELEARRLMEESFSAWSVVSNAIGSLPKDKALAKLALDSAIGNCKFLLKRLQEQKAALVVKPAQTEIPDVREPGTPVAAPANAGGTSLSI